MSVRSLVDKIARTVDLSADERQILDSAFRNINTTMTFVAPGGGSIEPGSHTHPPYAQIINVAKSGAEFATIQGAINSVPDATSSKRYCIKVASGDYAETITMKDYVDIVGSGRTNSRITGTSGTVLTFPATKGTVIDMGISVTYGTLAANSVAITSAGADSAMIRCDITVSKSAGDYTMKAITVTAGAFRMKECYFTYTITGATTATALTQVAVEQTGALTLFLLHNNEITMSSNDVNDELVGFATLTGSAGTFLLQDNIITLSATGAGATSTGLWLYGTATGSTVSRNRVDIYGKASAYGYYIDSTAGGATVNSRHNELLITSTGNAYSCSVATGDTWQSTFDKVIATAGYTGAGTVKYVSSESEGNLTITHGLIVNQEGDTTGDLRAEADTEANMLWLDASADLLYLGGSTNGVKIAKGGRVTLLANARVKKEIRIESIKAKLGAAAPSIAERAVGASGGVVMPVLTFSKTTQQDCYFIVHSPTDLDASATATFHLMWQPGAAWTTGNYMWKLEYLVINENGATLLAGTPTTISADVTPANATTNKETEFVGAITIAADQMMICHFYRDVANDNADDIGCVSFFELEYTANCLGEAI